MMTLLLSQNMRQMSQMALREEDQFGGGDIRVYRTPMADCYYQIKNRLASITSRKQTIRVTIKKNYKNKMNPIPSFQTYLSYFFLMYRLLLQSYIFHNTITLSNTLLHISYLIPSSIFHNLFMKQIAAQFQASFFNYQIPKQFTSIYDQEYVRSNDLRLLLEIATATSLRMFTDPKTGKLHFICKQRGSSCFDINAIPHPKGGYFFCYDYLKVTHKENCRQHNEAYQYLIIYNLMKLKKKLIEDYMLILDAEKDSPSLILAKLSKQPGMYFFEKYINGHLELKRKLRKRFDNIVNIDIKKIGKPEEEEKKVKKAKIKKTKVVNKGVKLKKMARKIAAQRKRMKQYYIARKMAKKVSPRFKIQTGFPLPTKIRRKFLDHNRKSAEINPLEVKIQEDPFDDQKWKVKCQEEEQILPEIRELSERAQYIWSQSEPQSPNSYPNYLQINIANYQDYFKSLRNSTLKKSLERQSLTKCFFSTDSNPCKENKQ